MNPNRRTANLLLVGLVAVVAGFAAIGIAMARAGVPASSCTCTALAGAQRSFTLGNGIGWSVLGALFVVVVRTTLRSLRAIRHSLATLGRERIVRRTLDGVRVSVIPGSEPRAYCVGGLHPAIVVSVGTLLLPIAERNAVLAHERAHATAHDPLVLAVLDALTASVPPMRALSSEYRRRAEYAADDAARSAAGDTAFASALAKGIEGVPAAAAGFSPTEARVRRFLGYPHTPSRAPLVQLAAVTLGVLLSLTAAWFSVNRVTAREAQQCPLTTAICRAASMSRMVCFPTANGTACVAR